MSTRLKYIPEMDSLRALAVLMTLGAHFLPDKGLYHIPYLWYGVDLFFVISGFLITSILLNTKVSEGNISKFQTIKNFYIRRVLRLFPIYYLFILFFFLSKHIFNLYIWKDDYNLYFFTYLQNLYFFVIGSNQSMFSHLWSLGVEEQFYLIWPFLIIFLPNRLINRFIIFIIILSILLNAIFIHIPFFRGLTFSNFHTLGIGALLGYYYCIAKDNVILKQIRKYRLVYLIISLVLLIIVLNYQKLEFTYTFVIETLVALCGVLLVINTIYGWPSILAKVIKNKLLQHIGKVSYGIYLFHMPIPFFLHFMAEKLHITTYIPINPAFLFLFYFLVTYLIATLSFAARRIACRDTQSGVY